MTQQQKRLTIPPALYRDIEREVMPIIRSAAYSFATKLGMDKEDAVQEGRLALAEALESYDYNLSKGGIHAYARAAVTNALTGLMYRQTTRGRVPHIVVNDDGVLKTMRSWPVLMGDFEVTPGSDLADPEASTMDSEMTEMLREVKMQLLNCLNELQTRVFACLSNQDPGFQLFLRNVGERSGEFKMPEGEERKGERPMADENHLLIAEYLSGEPGMPKMNKNTIDWAVHVIKRHFTRIAETKFSETIQEAIKEGKWPMFHVSMRGNDVSFIQDVMKRRNLDKRPTGAPDVARREKDGKLCIRSVERYKWGSVIMLRFGTDTATVIAEGRFNVITGEVLCETGFWKSIKDHLPWYPAAHRFLEGN